jgi:CRISPR-associated protein Csb1
MPESTLEPLNLKKLQEAVTSAAAIRCVTPLEPVGHKRDKVYPPTYDGAVYAEERRVDDDGEHLIPAVLLDSVASQANRMELALFQALEEAAAKTDGDLKLEFPLLKVDFSGTDVGTPSSVSVLEAPHRIFDAIFRDSEVEMKEADGEKTKENKVFKDSEVGKALGEATLSNATPLFEYSPTSLIFGAWNSTKAVNGNAKFARALVSEIVGYYAEPGMRVGSRVDPLEIGKVPLYRTGDGDFDYTAHESKARTIEQGGKDEKEIFRIKKAAAAPSDINHGNVTPSVARAKEPLRGPGNTIVAERDRLLPGGVTMKFARQTTVLSLAALRRLRFPEKGKAPTTERDKAARTILAALGLVAMTASRRDYFLRSRCDLYPPELSKLQIVMPGRENHEPSYRLEFDDAVRLLNEAIEAATTLRPPLKWKESKDLPRIVPSQKLVDLIVIGRKHGGSETDAGGAED